MYSDNVKLNSREFFSKRFRVDEAKIKKAMENCLARLEKNFERFENELPCTINGYNKEVYNGVSNNRYVCTDKVDWKPGMYVGIYWLAYLLTKDERYKDNAMKHVPKFVSLASMPEKLNNHDTGFVFSPTCVAAYKAIGDEKAKEAAIKAADILMDHICQENGFIIRIGKRDTSNPYQFYRMLVDSMLNIPLLFWATEVTGDEKYKKAAIRHYMVTAKYLIREDGSSPHHYQFDPETGKPVGEVTLQGYADDSCWSRGHSWLVYGYPNAYKHTKDEETLKIHKPVAYYFLDHLPSDMIPYWDFVFGQGSLEPRDSSAAAIASCGLLEACKYLPDSDEDKEVFLNAAHRMLDALIDLCENRTEEQDGFIHHVAHAQSLSDNPDGIEVYGDYFYFELLVRMLAPDIEMFW